MLLLLLWRHLAYYAEGRHLHDPQLGSSTAAAMRFLSNFDSQALNLEIRQKLNPVLQRLQSLVLVCSRMLLNCVNLIYFIGRFPR